VSKPQSAGVAVAGGNQVKEAKGREK
jgi:hypothetical protein